MRPLVTLIGAYEWLFEAICLMTLDNAVREINGTYGLHRDALKVFKLCSRYINQEIVSCMIRRIY